MATVACTISHTGRGMAATVPGSKPPQKAPGTGLLCVTESLPCQPSEFFHLLTSKIISVTYISTRPHGKPQQTTQGGKRPRLCLSSVSATRTTLRAKVVSSWTAQRPTGRGRCSVDGPPALRRSNGGERRAAAQVGAGRELRPHLPTNHHSSSAHETRSSDSSQLMKPHENPHENPPKSPSWQTLRQIPHSSVHSAARAPSVCKKVSAES